MSWWIPTAKLVTDVDGAALLLVDGAAVLVDSRARLSWWTVAAFADSVDLSAVLVDSRAALSWWIPTAKLVTDVDGADWWGAPSGAAVLVDSGQSENRSSPEIRLVDMVIISLLSLPCVCYGKGWSLRIG